MTDDHLDLMGLKCPQPVLRTRRALRRLPPGRTLVVDCTDPLAAIDIPHFAQAEGYRLLPAEPGDPTLRFRLRTLG